MLQQRAHLGDERGVFRLSGDIDVLGAVGPVVIEHAGDGRSFGVAPFGEEVGGGFYRFAGVPAAEGGRLRWTAGVLQQRGETVALHRVGRRQTGQFAQGGVDVDELDQGVAAAAAAAHPRRADDQRRVQRGVEGAVFAPQAVLAELPAVIAPEDHDRAVAQLPFVEGGEDASDLRVGVARGGLVAVNQCERLFLRKRPCIGDSRIVTQFAPCVQRLVGCVQRPVGVVGRTDVGAAVEIPIALGRMPVRRLAREAPQTGTWQ